MYPQSSGAYPGDTARNGAALSAWDAAAPVGLLHAMGSISSVQILPDTAVLKIVSSAVLHATERLSSHAFLSLSISQFVEPMSGVLR